MLIRFTVTASIQLDNIFSNGGIYDRYGHFTPRFINWNSEFHRYVNPKAVDNWCCQQKGVYRIGDIGTLLYNTISLNDTTLFQILEFRFTKLPYSDGRTQEYSVIGDAGYGYKILKSTFNGLCSLQKPNGRRLTKFAFDSVIGFHHSSDKYNRLHAIGFMGERVYSITMNGNIEMIPCSKQEYLEMNHKFYESIQHHRNEIPEPRLNSIVRESINRLIHSRY